MKIKKNGMKLIALIVVLSCAFSLTGCIGIDQENKTELALDEDGSITQTIVDDADNGVTGEELENYINEYIEQFYGQYTGESVALETCKVLNGKVNIVLKYSSANAYASFNNVICFNGTVKEAYDAGYDFNREFYFLDGDSLPYFELTRYSYNCELLIIEEAVTVDVPGDVYIVSSGLTVYDDGTVEVSENYDDDFSEEYSSTTVSPVFIIYEIN